MKISEFPEISSAQNNDLLLVEQASNNAFRKITKSNFLTGISGGGASVPTSPTAITSNLILDLHFTERTGQVINDNSGNNFNGISGNSTNTDYQDINYPSWINSGIEFNGDDYVYLPASNYFNGNFSVEIVFYQRNFDAWARLFDFGQAQALHNVLLSSSSNGSGRLHFDIVGNNQYSNPVISPFPTELFKWQYVSIQLEGNVGRIFRDCNLLTQGELLIPQNVTRSNCFLGKSNWNGEAYFNGLIGLFRIYNRVLTTTERISNYNQSKAWLASKGIIL